MIQGSGSSDIMENVKLEAKNIMTVVFLCIIFNSLSYFSKKNPS